MKNVDIYGEQFLLVNWEDTDLIIEAHACRNVIVAAFVTAQARLKLYVLEKLNVRVLYFDTDSIIYVHKPDQWNPAIINSRLGKWTNEVPNARIMKFVGMGPNNNGYEYVGKDGQRKSICKVKGLTPDYNISQLSNFHRVLKWAKSACRNFKETVDYQRTGKHKDKRVTTEKQ